MMMQFGIQTGWISPNLARLTAENSVIQMTTTQASWLLSSFAFGSLVGAILGSISMEIIGNRKTILLILILISISWICLIASNSIEWLFISRFLSGITGAMCLTCYSLFLAEVSRPEIRGTLISIATGGSPFGIIVGLLAETYLPMKISSSIYCVQCLITIIIFVCILDSPQYFIKTKNFEKARKSFAFYRIDCNSEEKIYETNLFLQSGISQDIKNKLMELKFPLVRRSMLLIIILFSLPHFSGAFIVISYMEIILNNGKFHLIEAQQFVIYANIVSVVTTVLSVQLISKFGRRFLLILSSIGSIVALTALGTYFYLLHNQIYVKNIQWLVIISVLLYLVSFSVGYAVVPSTVLSEIFSEKIKNLGACVSILTACISSFIILKTYQPMVDILGEEYVFWIYAVFTLIWSTWVLYLLPETKGKSLQEIQDELIKSKKFSLTFQ